MTGAQEVESQKFSAATRWNSSLGAPVLEPNDAKAQKEVLDSMEQEVPKEKYGISITIRC